MSTHTKICAECNRTMSADDAHHRCQKCRNGGRWPTGKTTQWQREYRARLRYMHREIET